MGIINWLKIQSIEAQLNKASHKIAYYKAVIEDTEERHDIATIKGRTKGNYDNAIKALAVWEH